MKPTAGWLFSIVVRILCSMTQPLRSVLSSIRTTTPLSAPTPLAWRRPQPRLHTRPTATSARAWSLKGSRTLPWLRRNHHHLRDDRTHPAVAAASSPTLPRRDATAGRERARRQLGRVFPVDFHVVAHHPRRRRCGCDQRTKRGKPTREDSAHPGRRPSRASLVPRSRRSRRRSTRSRRCLTR